MRNSFRWLILKRMKALFNSRIKIWLTSCGRYEKGRERYVEKRQNTYQVHFKDQAVTTMVMEGTTLLQAEIDAGLVPDAPCGGQGKCGKCRVFMDGKEVLACQTKIQKDCQVRLLKNEKEKAHILNSGILRDVPCHPGVLPKEVRRPILAAVDLGTTTMDGESGELLCTRSMLNPQREFGADVVMRCSYVLEHGPRDLSGCVREAIDSLLGEAAAAVHRRREEIVKVVMAGNTCMHHLFLEFPVDTLVKAPYVPRVTKAVERKASDCGFHLWNGASVLWLPNIGGFVGADTTACMLEAEFDRRQELTLLVDIGTNGEMVLGNRDGFTVCSTAAGPAFEGAKITCGMRGSEGAIDHVYLKDGKVEFHVIGGGAPAGICGSGLLDAVYCLLQTGWIREDGYMKEPWHFSKEVFLNQKDVRELQLAKAAIAAGIRLLCRKRGCRVSEIQTLLLAGAFGNYLDPESACGIGLLPEALRERILPVGNAAGAGARLAVLSLEEFRRAEKLAEKAEFLELAAEPDFMDVYVDEMSYAKEDWYGN